ncbi:MAG: lactate utilization protein [Acidobacteriota bacterium]
MTGTNTGAREAILASIRSNLAASAPFDAVRSEHHGSPSKDLAFSVPTLADSNDLIGRFRTNLESVGGECVVASNDIEASSYLRDLIATHSVKRAAISDSELVRRIADPVEGVEIIEQATVGVLFDCDIGITGAQFAIAETGTIVLISDSERNRLTSLIPPIHVCVLRSSDIRETMREILDLTKVDLSAAITFITGASRTSDIELTLAIGVHGPRELHVIVIEG